VSTEEKIEALAAALDRVGEHVDAVDATARRSEKNRLSMLHLHAAAAILVGCLFAAVDNSAMQGPNWIVIKMIPGAPESLGYFLLAGGLILGPSTWYRRLFWEKVGLWIILLWYATISTSFGTATLLWLAGDNPSPITPAFYAPIVYLHLSCVMMVHLITLGRMTRPQQRSS
jgi:hypothetical protein